MALVVVLFAVTRPPASVTPTSHPTSSASASWGLPFTSPDGTETGQWQVVSDQWEADGLHATIRIAVQRGPFQPAFVAFVNNSADIIQPLPSADFPLGFGQSMSSGDDRTGTLIFPMQQGSATIILGDSWGSQLSALPVSG